MSVSFIIPIPERMPSKIDPCPVVEAAFELRFVTSEPWRTLPGLLAFHIKDKYPDQKDLPLASFPEDARKQDPVLTYQPLMQFLGKNFLIQLGPRVISLCTKQNQYNGWVEISREINWVLEKVNAAGFISEGERLGVRYINFFQTDVFPELILSVHVASETLSGVEMHVSSALKRDDFAIRLNVANGAMVILADGPKRGSVIDIDVSLGPLEFEVFENGLTKFGDAHRILKEIFFGLLKSEFLATLHPTY